MSLRRPELTATAVLLAGLLVVAMSDLAGLGPQPPENLVRDIAYSLTASGAAVLAAAAAIARRSLPAALVSAGLTCWAVAFTFHSFEFRPLVAGWIAAVDIGWLLGYPCFYAAIVILARRRIAQRAGVWLDGISGALALGAAALAIVAPTIVEASHVHATSALVALAYPTADALLLTITVTVAGMTGWRAGRAFGALALAFAMLIVTDLPYFLQIKAGTFEPNGLIDVMWLAVTVALATAAWQQQPSRDPVAPGPVALLVFPGANCIIAIGVLLYGATTDVPAVALLLATLALAAALTRALASFREVHELAESRRLSMTDDLTSLPNRRWLMRALAEATAEPAEPAAVLLLDLDGFKELNDTLGHQAGDVVLTRVAARLSSRLRGGDVAARLGGDEFAVVVRGRSAANAPALARRLCDAVAEPITIEGLRLHVGASVGVALAPEHGDDPELLLRRADRAMYRAKQAGQAVSVYAEGLDAGALDRLRLAGELAGALEREELVIHLQPITDMVLGTVVAAEALIRWQHPERGLLGPCEFLPALERTDLNRRFSRYVLERAVKQAAAWRASGRPLTISVNLTATDLLDSSLPGIVAELLLTHRAAATDLQLEVTESGVLSDIERTHQVISELRKMGLRIALDDFGTGHSSLTHLQRLPVDVLKIDRSFVATSAEDGGTAAIVQAIIDLAHTLGKTVVAEGIEDEALWRQLAAWGCDSGQGWLISPAVPPAELRERIDECDSRGRGIAFAAAR